MGSAQFDDLFVISDIHLGGEAGFQVFNQQKALSSLIRGLAERDENREVGLVLNGDIVDFLAESPPVYFDYHRVVEKLDRIVHDPAFADVFEALKDFVNKPKRHLILVLGNHDVELALPAARSYLENLLYDGADVEKKRGRITFAMDGTGYRARVGCAEVLCLHGNEMDAWNVVDYFALSKTIQAQNRDNAPQEWKPNAGTRMVIDVLNDFKRKYRWIDLLKPEGEAVMTLLLSLDPQVASKLMALPGIAGRLSTDRLRMEMGFLSEDEVDEKREPALFQEAVEGAFSEVYGELESEEDLELLIQEIEDHIERKTDPISLVGKEEEFLSLGGDLWRKIKGKSKEVLTRHALKRCFKDHQAFEHTVEDATYKAVSESVGPEIDFVIAGHTHLHRAIPLGAGAYFNSGTWIRLMHIKEHMLEKQPFSQLWDLLSGECNIEALDNARIGGEPLVLNIRSVVAVQDMGNGVSGRLFEYREVEGGDDFELAPVSKDFHKAGVRSKS